MITYLPKYYNKNAGTWVDLEAAYQATVNGWQNTLDTFRNGYIFTTADATQIKFLEELYKVPVDETLPMDYRIGRLQAKLLPAATTRNAILNITKHFYPNETPVLSEVEADYTLTIFFHSMQIIPTDIDVYKKTIQDIIQADIDFSVLLDVTMKAFTHAELSAQLHGNLTAYKYG